MQGLIVFIMYFLCYIIVSALLCFPSIYLFNLVQLVLKEHAIDVRETAVEFIVSLDHHLQEDYALPQAMEPQSFFKAGQT